MNKKRVFACFLFVVYGILKINHLKEGKKSDKIELSINMLLHNLKY